MQLKHTVNRDSVFRHYYYRSGTNQTMREHLGGIAEEASKRVNLKPDDIVMDIGSNDGTMLDWYPTSVVHIGFEPSQLYETSSWRNSGVINDFFNAGAFNKEIRRFTDKRKAKLVTAISMFYDLDNPGEFLEDVKQILAPDGLFVIQQNYLPSMLKNNAVDNIVHEHLEYYSLYTLEGLLFVHDFQIVDYSFNNLNGGSFRVYVKHVPSGKVLPIADFPEEELLGFDAAKPYQEFYNRVREIIYKLSTFIPIENYKGRSTYIYGASTRGATTFQLMGLDSKAIPFAVERNPAKWGTMYLGKIPVISEEQARKFPPAYYLVLPWHFIDEFARREKAFLDGGGKFIVPFPQPYLLGKDGKREEL